MVSTAKEEQRGSRDGITFKTNRGGLISYPSSSTKQSSGSLPSIDTSIDIGIDTVNFKKNPKMFFSLLSMHVLGDCISSRRRYYSLHLRTIIIISIASIYKLT